ncbi:MAG: TldD/PmbA family protein [Alphaproteobacteria bacterium]|nr:MAG: TldD/PmbA family protein [Alphaproteobacteria bacterium]
MTTTAEKTEPLTLLGQLVDSAIKAGADSADAVMFDSASLSANCRLGRIEEIERSEAQDIGLRVMIGQRQATVSTTDLMPQSLWLLVERAVAMARSAPEDPYCGLAERELLASSPLPELDLFDETTVSPEDLEETARAVEDAARAVRGVTNSEGSSASVSTMHTVLVTSDGFAGEYRTTYHGFSVSVLAEGDDGMERDYDFSSARFRSDLESPEEVGRRAGNRAVRRINPRKPKTARVPVVFEPRVASSIIGHLASAANGQAVARGTSFLKDQMGKAVFAPGIRIVDDPLRPRGLSSRPFDGEGVAASALDLVTDGVLSNWLLDSATARQLGLRSNGRARRSTSSPPAPGTSNLYMAPGSVSPDALISDIKSGFYVTELIGMGVNPVTGDYSKGAAGFWIENGKITYPVSEITIAGNLKDMFRALAPADDLEFRIGTDAPTIRIDGMTVAGA